MSHFVITANDLRDGAIVWLRAEAGGFGWTTTAAAASVAGAGERDAWLAAAEADARRNRVVAPYAIDVAARPEGGFAHTSTRERVRAGGPTVGNSLPR